MKARTQQGWQGRSSVGVEIVDRSGVEGQSQVLTEINDMKTSASGNLFALTEHLYNMYDLWLALSSSRKAYPAHFFALLFRSLPTLPDNSRGWCTCVASSSTSSRRTSLKKSFDDDDGLFDKVLKYAESLGL